ncbi:MAG: M12 family metallo-peptidase [Bacteroidota bacterium]
MALFFLLIFQARLHGQNLIKDTQAGIAPKTLGTATPNRVAEWLKAEHLQNAPTAITLFDITKQNQALDYQAEVEEAVYLTLSKRQLAKLMEADAKTLSLTVPVAKNRSFQLELAKVELVAEKFTVETSSGSNLTQEEIGGVFYRGIVKDNQRSIAALSVFPDHLQLIIADRAGNYVLAPLPSEKAFDNKYVLYAEQDLIGREKSECKVEVVEEDFVGVELKKFQSYEKSDDDRCLQVYLECDFSLFNATGGTAIAAAQYVQSVFNVSATIYQNEGLAKELSQIFVWTTEDPFSGINFSGAILDQFILSKNQTGFPGNYAHFLTARLGPQGIAAAFDCTLPFALTGFIIDRTGAFPTPSLDVSIFAHEMGHNMGSLHTHGCYWNSDTYGFGTQIDDCGNANRVEAGFSSEGAGCVDDPFNPIIPEEGGTIMSYCDQSALSRTFPGTNFEFAFGPQPGEIIRMNYNNPPDGCTNLNELQANLNCTEIGSVFAVDDLIALEDIRVENQGDFPIGASNLGITYISTPSLEKGIIKKRLSLVELSKYGSAANVRLCCTQNLQSTQRARAHAALQI